MQHYQQPHSVTTSSLWPHSATYKKSSSSYNTNTQSQLQTLTSLRLYSFRTIVLIDLGRGVNTNASSQEVHAITRHIQQAGLRHTYQLDTVQ
jgi:hypothetical protein